MHFTRILAALIIFLGITPARPNGDIHTQTITSQVTEERKTGSVTSSSLTSTSELTITTEPLPGDSDSFETIRENGKVYVDKTGTLKHLLDCGNKQFLFARPRRFGKTLFVQMMRSFFRGEQSKLFEGLKISEHGNIVYDKIVQDETSSQSNAKWVKYPVIDLNFSELTFDTVSGSCKGVLGQVKTDLIGMLKHIANSETQQEIWNGVRNYVPFEHESFKKAKRSTPNSLRQLMSSPDISGVIERFSRDGFFFSAALNDTVSEFQVTRRLLTILRVGGVMCEGAREFFSEYGLLKKSVEGVIDITTLGLPTNYAIEIKCGKGKEASALDGIKKLIEYATKTEMKRVSFIEAFGGSRVYLLTIHFDEASGGKIDEWVFLPFAGFRLRFDELKASCEDLYVKVKNMISKMNIKKEYMVDFET